MRVRLTHISLVVFLFVLALLPRIVGAQVLPDDPQWSSKTLDIFNKKHRVIQGKELKLDLSVNPGYSGSIVTCDPANSVCGALKIEMASPGIALITIDSTHQVFSVGKDLVTSIQLEARNLPNTKAIKGTLKVGVDPNPCFKFKTDKLCAQAKDCKWEGNACFDGKGEEPPVERGFSGEEIDQSQQDAQKTAIESSARGAFENLGGADVPTLLGTILQALLGVVGSIALGLVVFGGIMVMTSGGNAERTKQGTQILVWSALGVIAIFASYALVDLVFDVFR